MASVGANLCFKGSWFQQLAKLFQHAWFLLWPRLTDQFLQILAACLACTQYTDFWAQNIEGFVKNK